MIKEEIFHIQFRSRQKRYTLHDQMAIDHNENVLHSIRQIDIYNEKSLLTCTKTFPNVTSLHLKNGFNTPLEISLTRFIPREQINKLVIECHHYSLKKIIDLLSHLPNIQILIFESMPLYKDDYLTLEQTETFQHVSERNHIKQITFHDQANLDKIKLLIALCPRLEHLSIRTLDRIIKPAIHLLFDRNNPNTHYLSSLWFSEVSATMRRRLRRLFQGEELMNDYMVKVTDSYIYLWR